MRLLWSFACAITLGACAARGSATRAPALTQPSAQEPSRVQLRISAQSGSFAAAVREYEEIWRTEGKQMVAAMEATSGIRFDAPPEPDTIISVIVYEGVSYSGSRGRPLETQRPMLLRASYPADTKRSTLIHELGHRLQIGVASDHDEHEVLYLWIYDTWVALWGKDFADAQVLVERGRRGPYPRAWDAAMALTAAERAARFRSLRERKRFQ